MNTIRIISKRLLVLLSASALMIPFTTGCHSRMSEESKNLTVNAPVDGIVRRVIVDPDAAVDKDGAIIEIAVQPAYATPDASKVRVEEARVAHARADLAAAAGEMNRIVAELPPIERLARRGLASQAELDKARSQAMDAQERVRVASEKAKNAETRRDQASSPAAAEQIIVVRAPAAGTVQAVNVHAGQVVVTGQPLVTLVSNS